MRIVHVVAIMAGFTLAGIVLRRIGLVSPNAAAKLNRVALSFTMPAGIFLSLHDFEIRGGALKAPALAAVLTFVLWGLAEAAARALRLERPRRAVFVLAVVFGNTAFIGFPVIAALYGTDGLAQAVLIDQIGAEPLAFTLGALVAARGSPQAAGPVAWRAELRALLTFPPMLALAAGLAWKLAGLATLPDSAQRGLGLVGAATVPLVMVALGLVVRAGSLREALVPAAVVSALRLVVSPLLGFAGARVLGLAPGQLAVTTLELGMPTMMFTLVLAIRYRLDVELTAAFVTATMVASLVTLPVWAVIVG